MYKDVEVVIGKCMDRRLGPKTDEITKKFRPGTFRIVSNAGANYKGLSETVDSIVEKGKVKKIFWNVHDGCGACAVVDGVFKHKIEVSQSVTKAWISQFKDTGRLLTNASEIESYNTTMEEKALREKYESKGITTQVELIRMADLNVPEYKGEYSLIIGKPYSGTYEKLAKDLGLDIWSMYVLHSESIIDVMPDIEIAVLNLHIKKLKIVGITESEHEWAEEEKRILNNFMPFIRSENAEVEVVKL